MHRKPNAQLSPSKQDASPVAAAAPRLQTTSEQVLAEFVQPERLEKLAQVAAARTKHLTIVLDNIHNPHNISAVVRSADAFGLSSLHFVGASFQVSRGIALGADRWLDIKRYKDAAECIAELKNSGYKVVVTGPEDNLAKDGTPALPVHNLPFQEKLALVFGNEKLGVSQEFSAEADLSTFIPMHGFVESFNISVAAAICMYTATLAINSAERQTPLLSEAEQAELRGEWLKDDVRGAELILKRKAGND